MVANFLYERGISHNGAEVHPGMDGRSTVFVENFSENYTATMMQAGEFAPTPHSKLMYNEAFRANQYVAAGIKPIYVLNDMFQFRTEFYGFTPIFR